AGDIAARPAQISDEPLFHRICTGVEYHGNCGGRVLSCLVRGWSTHSSDYVEVAADEGGRELRETLVLALTPAVFDGKILSFDIAALFEALAECGELCFDQ